MKWFVALGFATALLFPSAAHAQLLDPATLHVYFGSDPGTDPNPLGGTGALTIGQVSGGQPAANLNPVLLIIGIPNDPSTGGNTYYGTGSPNPISSVSFSSGGTATAALGGTNIFGMGWNTSTGFGGTLADKASTDYLGNAVNTDEAYTILLAGGGNKSNGVDNSNSWTNWATVGYGNVTPSPDITPTSFSLYVFTLTDTSGLSDKGTINVQFATGVGLPEGAYAIAFSNTMLDGSGSPYANPFTEAGVEQPPAPPPGPGGGGGSTPAPPAFMMAGIGILLLGAFRFARRRRLVAV
jgi:hypothetical protein